MNIGGLVAIKLVLFESANDLHDLQTLLNERKSTTPSCIMTNKSTSWLRFDHGDIIPLLLVLNLFVVDDDVSSSLSSFIVFVLEIPTSRTSEVNFRATEFLAASPKRILVKRSANCRFG